MAPIPPPKPPRRRKVNQDLPVTAAIREASLNSAPPGIGDDPVANPGLTTTVLDATRRLRRNAEFFTLEADAQAVLDANPVYVMDAERDRTNIGPPQDKLDQLHRDQRRILNTKKDTYEDIDETLEDDVETTCTYLGKKAIWIADIQIRKRRLLAHQVRARYQDTINTTDLAQALCAVLIARTGLPICATSEMIHGDATMVGAALEPGKQVLNPLPDPTDWSAWRARYGVDILPPTEKRNSSQKEAHSLIAHRYAETLRENIEEKEGPLPGYRLSELQAVADSMARNDKFRDQWHTWHYKKRRYKEDLLIKGPASDPAVDLMLARFQTQKETYVAHPVALAIAAANSTYAIADAIRQADPQLRHELVFALVDRTMTRLEAFNDNFASEFQRPRENVDFGHMVPLLRAAGSYLTVSEQDPLSDVLDHCYGRLDLWTLSEKTQMVLGVIGLLTLCAMLPFSGPVGALLLSTPVASTTIVAGLISATNIYLEALRQEQNDKTEEVFDAFEGTIEMLESDHSVGWAGFGLALEFLGALTFGAVHAMRAVPRTAPRAATTAFEGAEAMEQTAVAGSKASASEDVASGLPLQGSAAVEDAASARTVPRPEPTMPGTPRPTPPPEPTVPPTGQSAAAHGTPPVDPVPLQPALLVGDVEEVGRRVAFDEPDALLNRLNRDFNQVDEQFAMVLYEPQANALPVFEVPPLPVPARPAPLNQTAAELSWLRGQGAQATLFDLANATHNVPMTVREREFLEIIYAEYWRKLAIDADTVHELRLWATGTAGIPSHRAAAGIVGEIYTLNHVNGMERVQQVRMIAPESVPGTRWPDFMLRLDDGAEAAMEVRTVTMEPRMITDPATGQRTVSRMNWTDDLMIDDVGFQGLRRGRVAGGARGKIRHGQISAAAPGYVMVVVAQEVSNAAAVISPRQMAGLQRYIGSRDYVYGVYISYRTLEGGNLMFIENLAQPGMRLD